MKEENKLFKFVNNFYEARCRNYTISISDDQVLLMKSRVFLFQLIYDKIHNEVLKKLHNICFDNNNVQICV